MGDAQVQAAVRSVLEDFNAALRSKDPTIAQSFDKHAIFLGSEPGESARGQPAIAALLGAVLNSPGSVQFSWSSVEADRAGQTVWFVADGEVVIANAAGEKRRSYRLSGVLTQDGTGWRWRLFHGSEPWIAPQTQAGQR